MNSTTEDYKRKLTMLINQQSLKQKKKKETLLNSSTSSHVKIETDNKSLSTPRKSSSKNRKATPYHSTISNLKLSTKNLKQQALFKTTNDYEANTVNEYPYMAEESAEDSSSSSPSHVSKKLKKRKQKSSESFKVERENKEISLKRPLTPYYLINKKAKKNVYENQSRVLFEPKTEIASDPEEYMEFPGSFSTSKSKSPTKNDSIAYTHNNKKTKKFKKGANIKPESSNNVDDLLHMNVTEVIYDNQKHGQVSYSMNEISSNEDELSDSRNCYNSDEDIVSKFDCSNSFIDSDISSTVNREINNESCEYDQEDILEEIETSPYETEICLDTSFDRRIISDINATEVGQADYFSLKNALLIVFHNNSKLYFHGCMSVSVLYGTVEVLGYTLNTSSNAVQVFSPRGSSFLYFEAKETISECTSYDLRSKLCDLEVEHKIVDAVCQNLQPNSAVILCKEIIRTDISFIKKHIPQQIFPKCENKMPQCVFQNKIGNWNVLKTSAEWDMLVQFINSSSRAFICGGKSVGKSTMLRYIINKLLLKYPQMLFIDLDPGQPEFTVPGCISSTIVTEPVFGPNYTHLRQPHRCLFVPNINVSYDPSSYLKSVKKLVLLCSDLPKMPVLINYMGFTRGLGLEIFSAAVVHTRPTYIIQIQSNLGSKNFRNKLSYELILDKSKLLAPEVSAVPHFDIATILSMADVNEGWHLQPRQIREMCVLSYLSRMLPADVLSLTYDKVPVYVVDMSQIRIIYNNRVVTPAAVNGNFVALCSLETSCKSYTCFGWGVVRGIDLSTNELFLLTPLSLEELEEVNYLILGSVSLPPSLYMTSDSNVGLIPFISEGLLTTLGKIPKRSYLPPKGK